MDSLNKAFAQVSDAVKSMTPAARMTAAASLAFVVVSVTWLANQQATEPEMSLMGGQSFSATQLRDMEGAFGKAGLADYRIDGDRVYVPRGQQAKYMAALADDGAMPEDFGEHLRKAVNAPSFMLSGPRQEAQTKVALQSDLQLAISRLGGVKNAFVHIAEETSPGFPATKNVTASVVVEPRGEAAIDEATIADIRSLVASAWPGLKPEAVTVVRTGHERSPPATAPAEDSRALSWLARNWKPLGTGGLILVGLFVLRTSIRPDPRGTAQHDASAAQVPKPLLLARDDAAVPAGGAAGVAPSPPPTVVVSSESLRDELIVMIREHPRAAAGVLRTWIGSSSQ